MPPATSGLRLGVLASLLSLVVSAGCDDAAGTELGDSGAPITVLPDGSSAPSFDGGGASLPDSALATPSDAAAPPSASAWCAARAVLQTQCTSCHANPVQFGAPMPLVTYEDTQAAAPLSAGKKVFEALSLRIHDGVKPMPPADHAPLSPAQLAALDTWVAGGAVAGADPTCASAPVVDAGVAPDAGGDAPWPTDCDRTVKILARSDLDPTAKYPVQPNTQEYKTFILDAPWGSDDVQAVAFRPITDNTTVLHHWILYRNNNGVPGAFLNGWAPGAQGGPLPADVGELMPKGARSLLIQFHYWNLAPGSKIEPDASGVEVCIMNKEHFRKNSAEIFQGFSSFLFSINRGEMNKDVVSNCKVTASQPIHLLTSSPHMHTLGRYAKLVVKRANGMTETLHDKVFDFEEQRSYAYDHDVILNNGDTVTTTCTFSFPQDDTAHVKNGALMQTVRFGQYTEDEMCYNFSLYYPAGGLSCGAGGLFGG